MMLSVGSPDSEWAKVEGILITNDPVEAYDGVVKLADPMLYSIAERVNSGSVPFLTQHDASQPIRTRNVEAWVEDVGEGRLLVRFSAEVVRSDWEKAGELRGVSIAAFAPIGGDELSEDADNLVRVAADAAWFTDAAISDAVGRVGALSGNAVHPLVTGARLYQFSATPDPRVIVETSLLLWQALGPNLVASAIWDGLKLLIARRTSRDVDPTPETSVEIHLLTPGGGRLSALVRTHDSEVARQAVEKLPDLSRALEGSVGSGSKSSYEWVHETGTEGSNWKWKRLT